MKDLRAGVALPRRENLCEAYRAVFDVELERERGPAVQRGSVARQ